MFAPQNLRAPLKHAASRFSVRKTVTKKKKKRKKKKKKRMRVTPGWTDISGPGPVSFFIQKFHVLHYPDST